MSKLNLKSQHTINWGLLLFFGLMTLTTIIGVPIYIYRHGISAPNLALFIFWSVSTGMAITVGYHRLFAHFSFKTNSLITFLCLFFGSAAFTSSAIRWVAQHRDHHIYLDREGDPYNINEGFFNAYIGWIWFRVHRFNYYNAKVLIKSKLMRHQCRYYMLWFFVAGIIIPTLSGLLTNSLWGSFLLNVVARMTFINHCSFVVNSVCHSFGKTTYSTSTSARDFWPAAFVTYGEAYHNFHHRFPTDYRHGVRWYDWDPSKWLIATLAFLGLAWDLKRVPDAQIEMAKRLAEKESADKDQARFLRDSLHRA